MLRVAVAAAVNLYQREARGIVGLLQEIEARDAGFQPGGACIFDGSQPERLEVFRFHVDVDEKNEHGTTIMAALAESRQGETVTAWRFCYVA